MQDFKKYERQIDVNAEESLAKIARKIQPNSVVLDIGCGAGMLGKFLVHEKKCVVDGIDLDYAALELCKFVYRKTVVKNLENDILSDTFEAAAYDYIIVADVIEHLVDPSQLLNEIKKLIRPSGTIIFSVPNITHIAAGFELLLGQFEYSSNGLLDSTHLRFFTKISLLKMLSSAGFFAFEIDSVNKPIEDTEFSTRISNIFPKAWKDKLISLREDALTYQWLVSTNTNSSTENELTLNAATSNTIYESLSFKSELYYSSDVSLNFDTSHCILGQLAKDDPTRTVIHYTFATSEHVSQIKSLRIDPISDKHLFLIEKASLISPDGIILWSNDPRMFADEVHGAEYIKSFGNEGTLFQATSNDPQWIPKIDQKILNSLKVGTIFTISLRVGESLSNFLSRYITQHTQGTRSEVDVKNLTIAKLHTHQNMMNELVISLKAELASVRASNSWKITKPMRILSHVIKQLVKGYQLFKNYRKVYPNLAGLIRIFRLVKFILWKSGFRGLVGKIKSFTGFVPVLENLTFEDKHDVIRLSDIHPAQINFPQNIAVHAHIFYVDLAEDLFLYLQNIPVAFVLYVTTDTIEKSDKIKTIFSKTNTKASLEVVISENKGRDIFPMLVSVGARLSKYDLVLHIHTKRSPHESLNLCGWRRYLLECLLGTPERVAAIVNEFNVNEKLGIFFPNYFHPIKPFVYKQDSFNKRGIKKILQRAGRSRNESDLIDITFFPAGDMFWFRGKAIEPFLKLNLTAVDFEPEEGQLNLTLAHAIERTFPYFAGLAGFETKAYLPTSFFSSNRSAHDLKLFKKFVNKNVIVSPHIIFDHNGGGGTNVFTTEFIKANLLHKTAVLRIFCSEGVWFVEWYTDGDGMHFYTASLSDLFETLAGVQSAEITINSLYGTPDLMKMAEFIITLKNQLGAKLDIKMHDFLALCSSPHLMDSKGKYCNVPKDPNICKTCLSENRGWYHSWYPKENIPTSIADWRLPFKNLFAAATTLSFFDKSSVEIMLKGIDFESAKVRLDPHQIEYFIPDQSANLAGALHIGMLGTLTPIKGSNILKSLDGHITASGLNIPITVVGSSVVDVPPGVNLHGRYLQSDLSKIIHYYGINVILMPSIVPETFSYTISEAMAMGLPIVTFDIGAQGNRVREYALGEVIPLNSSAENILSSIQNVLKKAQELKK